MEGAESQDRSQDRPERGDRFEERGDRAPREGRERFDRGPRRDRDDRGERRFDRPREERRPVEDDAGALPAFLTAPMPPRAPVAVEAAPEPMVAEAADAPAPKRRGRPPKAKTAEPAAE